MADKNLLIASGFDQILQRYAELTAAPGVYAQAVALWGSVTGTYVQSRYWPEGNDAISPQTLGAGLQVHANLSHLTSNAAGAAMYDRQRMARSAPAWVHNAALAAGAEQALFTPNVGKKFRTLGWSIATDVAGFVSLRDGAAGTTIAAGRIAAGSSWVFLPPLWEGQLSAAANNVLMLHNEGAAAINVDAVALVLEE